MPITAFHGSKINNIKRRESSPLLFPAFWFVIFIGALISNGAWAGTHGFLLATVGLMMVIFPPIVALPRNWWILAGGFLLFGAASFLPASWFGIPEWRQQLKALGLDTGSLVAIQPRLAFENYLLITGILLTGLWIAGHRLPSKQFRQIALAFTMGVAFFAIFSHFRKDSGASDTFGFFTNRNQTGTYFAMGALCGIGATAQFIREKAFFSLIAALATTIICFWALIFWSATRGGIALTAGGSLLWLIILGPAYLGKTGRRAIAVIAVLLFGLFLIAESRDKTPKTESAKEGSSLLGDPSQIEPADVDLRIPIALDTFQMIRHFPWTGVGAGHFYFIIPQYRGNTAAWSESSLFHPNSDWLWVTSEMGILSAVCLLGLLVLACKYSLTLIAAGRDRSLRTGALVAAILLPLHGLMDVPGHRIALIWAALLMLMLSIRGSKNKPNSTASCWLQRGAGLLVFLGGLWMAQAHIKENAAMVMPLPERYFSQTAQLVKEDKGTSEALEMLNRATESIPMDYKLYYAIGAYSSKYPNLESEIDRAFAIERTLCPFAAHVPYRQALLWQKHDTGKALDLWEESLSRAAQIDFTQPNSRWSEANTLLRIQQATRIQPELFHQLQNR